MSQFRATNPNAYTVEGQIPAYVGPSAHPGTLQPADSDPYGYGYQPGAYAGADEYYDDDADDMDGLGEWMDDDDFARNLQFGLIDNGLLVAMALAGISLEGYIADRVGVSGYGVLLGATLGNALSDSVAAMPQGAKAAAGVTVGALLPVIPLGIAVAMKKEPTGTTRNILLGTSAAMLAFALLSKQLRKRPGERA